MKPSRWNILSGSFLLFLTLFFAAAPASAQYQYPDECYDIEYRTVVVSFFGMRVPREREVSRRLRQECVTPPDNRINAADAAPEAAIYCTESGVAIWDINLISQGEFSFLVPYEALAAVPANPDTNTLIREHGGFRLYRLTSGELQLNSPPDWQGKEYVFTWSGCVPPGTP